ncbi:unnamed protein product, partial [Mesorhabditis belari]|uniref:Mucin n=1 Tax=Mesorhabditis belari TaxID=2138241 RepID=A0AAF3EG22_9BILA
MGFLFSTAAIVLLMFARRTRADTCPDTSPHEYVNVGYGMDAPAADGYNPMIGGTPLCFLWPVPTTTSTTTTTTTTPFTGSTTTGPTTTTASTTTFTTVSTTTGSTVSTTSYTGSSTTASTVSTTSFTGSTTTGTTVTTTSYTGPSTSTDSTTTGSSTTPYTGSSTTASSTTPYSGSSTTEASTLPYTGPSTTAGQSTLASLGSKIGWPIWIAGVLIASLVIMAIIFGATWAFIRGGSSTNPTTNPYANQAHGYKAAHADLPPQPVQPANTGVSTMNVGPTWTQPHSMYY